MARGRLLHRVWVVTATTGQGTVTLGAAVAGYATPAEAGGADNDKVNYVIEDGSDFEVGRGTYSSTGPTLSRDLVYLSKIGGTAGTTKLTLSGSAKVQITAVADDFAPDRQVFDASGTWTKPASGTVAYVQAWGGGGSGSRGSGNGGGGGGGYVEAWLLLSALGATETVTVGAGGAGVSVNGAGNVGGNSSFGAWLTAYGGGGGTSTGGGGGGGPLGAGGGGTPGAPLIVTDVNFSTSATDFHGSGAVSSGAPGKSGIVHGGGGGFSATAGGNSVWGGGGGGGNSSTAAGAGGTSVFGGNGGAAGVNGASGTAGSQPGGGGGSCEGVNPAVSGAGGAGRVIVTVF